ncbi:protein TIC 20-II, chloroplastic [Ipomoea triloba]|uniref:protein TIC 20-II, chloroplastic n=1 Tax=Ipomoea triloba TaxID=35885 RepID=UPI00125D2217|nr:protein TIC 20-II, chloroplastic [Ipomoea triloba]
MASTLLFRLSLPLNRPPLTTTKTTTFADRHRLLLPHPLKPITPKLSQIRSPPNPTKTAPITAFYTTTPATDRLISAVAYFLPFFNGLQYGRFLFAQFPALALPFEPILPLLALYRSIPFASFVTFFALYLGIVRNPSLSHYARFNALQALVLDILLVVPLLLQRILSPGHTGIGLKFTIWLYNGLFLFVVGCFLYGLVSSIVGKTPYFPLVTDAAKQQM